jgi:hypothetical protein
VADGNGLDREWDARFYRFWGQVSRSVIDELGPDPEKYDNHTLSRVRLRPVGRAAAREIGKTSDLGEDLSDLYNPEQTVAREFYGPWFAQAAKASVPVRVDDEWLDPPSPHRIQLLQGFRRESNSYRPVLKEVAVRTAKELRDLSESPQYRRSLFQHATGDWHPQGPAEAEYERHVLTPLREARRLYAEAFKEHQYDPFAFGDVGDGTTGFSGASVTRDMDQEFVPIQGGPYNKQLYLYEHWSAIAKCFEMKNHSELAKAAIAITSDFTLGRGVGWKIHNRKVADVWEEFWARNLMERRVRQWSDDFTWQGELIIRKDEPLKGFLRVRSIDPSSIYEIVTNPLDIEEVYLYHAQFPTQYQLPYNVLNGHRIDVPGMMYVVQQFPPNEILHVKNNVSAGEKWGRSDFYCALSTLKRHRDWTNASTLKDLLQANLVWKIKVHGDDADVQAFLTDPTNAQLPAFGGTWIENEALELTQLHSDVAASQRGTQGSTGAFLTSLFATSQQMPVSYFNQQGTGPARATALVQGEPFVKKISTRQQTFRMVLDTLYVEVMTAALRAGRLQHDDVRGADADPEWIFPSTYEEDRGAKFRDLGMAYELKSISHRSMSATMAQDLGFAEYSYEEELAEITNDQSNELLAPPTAPEGPGAAPGEPPTPGAAPGALNPREIAAGTTPQPMLKSAQAAGPRRAALPPQERKKNAPPSQHERIAGSQATAKFRAQSHQGPLEAKRLTETDRAFVETLVRDGKSGRVRLPSGRMATVRVKEALQEHTPGGEQHDQELHGNWANGGAQEKPTAARTRAPVDKPTGTSGKNWGRALDNPQRPTGLRLETVEEPVWHGKRVPVSDENKMNRQETGDLAEAIGIQWLRDQGLADAKKLRIGNENNFPLDLIEDHKLIEVKGGQPSNGRSGWHWRLTIGEPRGKRAEKILRMSAEQKRAFHGKAQRLIRHRKEDVLREFEKIMGYSLKRQTMGVIVNPDTKMADIFLWDGWHNRVGWNSDLAKASYRGTVKYAFDH